MNVIGIDYGVSKIGVAVGNTQTSSSSPLEIIINTKSGINWPQLERHHSGVETSSNHYWATF